MKKYHEFLGRKYIIHECPFTGRISKIEELMSWQSAKDFIKEVAPIIPGFIYNLFLISIPIALLIFFGFFFERF